MSFARIFSAQHTLLNAKRIDIEIDISKGLHTFSIVGLTDKAIDESKDRVSAAIKNSGFKPPKQKNEKLVVALAPAHLKKNGPIFDVAIAVGYLKASKDIFFDANHKLFLGELSLNGRLRSIEGILPLVRFAKGAGFKEVYIPYGNREEASLIEGIDIYPAETLKQIIDHINIPKGEDEIPKPKIKKQKKISFKKEIDKYSTDFSDIKGQESAKRAMLVAASGKHNIALYGPPGTGKTMLAKALCSILPALSFEESLDTTSIHSVSGVLDKPIISFPPFRSPHHTSSHVSIVGGGTNIRPGEITLAHNGVLFLDEFPEFDKRVIESLRQPLEDRVIHISRSKGSQIFPANIILITAMNPCPCGYFGSNKKTCTCAPHHVMQYQKKISGPIMDRIDLWVKVDDVNHEDLLSLDTEKSNSLELSKKVVDARSKQKERFKKNNLSYKTNGELNGKDIKKCIELSDNVLKILNQAAKNLDLSARSYHKVIKVARTIADLEDQNTINENHILEALQYRSKNEKI